VTDQDAVTAVLPSFDVRGQVALVTGAARGLGRAIALALAAAGADVALGLRDSGADGGVAAEIQALGRRALPLQMDIGQAGQIGPAVAAAVAWFGRLDILVNNAGTAIRKMPQDYTEEEWHLVMDTNLTSAFLCSQAAYAPMKAAGAGKMINIGSMMSLFGAPYATPYASSKGGIVQMTRAMATAWAKDNIQVNAVLPGWIDTDLTKRARREVPGLHERVENRTPAGRWGSPPDMAGIAAFLASPASDFVTGTAIPVDGGYSIGM
jgi:2-deoxy-D-gluconate 3-dehydrogenase